MAKKTQVTGRLLAPLKIDEQNMVRQMLLRFRSQAQIGHTRAMMQAFGRNHFRKGKLVTRT